ncbi:hypothetical protein F3C99_11195 [Vitellibacter sp. q18]|nr:hypothetical protein [Aequorivita lutea]
MNEVRNVLSKIWRYLLKIFKINKRKKIKVSSNFDTENWRTEKEEKFQEVIEYFDIRFKDLPNLRFEKSNTTELAGWTKISESKISNSDEKINFSSGIMGAASSSIATTGGLFKSPVSINTLQRYADGTISSIQTNNGLITGHAGFSPTNISNALFTPAMIYAVMAQITGQQYFLKMDEKLNSIASAINDLKIYYFNELLSKLENHFFVLKEINSSMNPSKDDLGRIVNINDSLNEISIQSKKNYEHHLMQVRDEMDKIKIVKYRIDKWRENSSKKYNKLIILKSYDDFIKFGLVSSISSNLKIQAKLLELKLRLQLADSSASNYEKINNIINAIPVLTEDNRVLEHERNLNEIKGQWKEKLEMIKSNIIKKKNAEKQLEGFEENFKSIEEKVNEITNQRQNIVEMCCKIENLYNEPIEIGILPHKGNFEYYLREK